MTRLELHHQTGRRAEVFLRLRPMLTGVADAAPLAIELKTSEGALRTALHRLRARFADELRAEIADTLADPTPEAIADELRDLFAALGGCIPGTMRQLL